MANKVQVKRSAVAGKIPTTTDIDLGELAINTYDGKLFLKKNVGGVETIVDVTASASANPIPTGTKMLFVQTAAPTGWTKDTTHNDKALRVVSGTASSGGTSSFSAVMSSSRASNTVSLGGTVGATTLSWNQMPSHIHGLRLEFGAAGQPQYPIGSAYNQINGNQVYGFSNVGAVESSGANWSHDHSLSINNHNHTTDLAIQYVDVIIATRA